jgi:aminoglycoside/choline kinase family phosphotransferase
MTGDIRSDDNRADIISDFLHASGFASAGLDWLAADASFRRYGRLSGGPRPALIMDAPPEHEDAHPWLRVARHLVALGFSAPAVIAEDAAAGLLLIEDFGDDTFTRLLIAGAEEHALYDLAIDVLASLHDRPADEAAPGWLPIYDQQRLLDEAVLFTDWYLPALRGQATGATEREDYLALMGIALAPVETGARTLVLRDYHVDNLMLLKGRAGIAACGLLDFQDAVAGHPAYDLISLIEDARRDLGPDVAKQAQARYFAARSLPESQDFMAAAAALAAARNAKIIGIFTRLAIRDGKHRYLAMIPRVWRHLEGDLAHPALGALAAWVDAAVSRDARSAPKITKETS